MYEIFGKEFIHIPTTKNEFLSFKFKFENSKDEAIEDILKIQEHMLSLAYDHLGEETVFKWFKVYPQKYSPEAILKLGKAF